MSGSWRPELERLMRSAIDYRALPSDLAELDRLLDENPDALNAYVSVMQIDSMLRWQSGRHAAPVGDPPGPIEINTRPDMSFSPVDSLPGASPRAAVDWLFSYGVAVVLVGIALIFAWAFQISHFKAEIAADRPARPPIERPEMLFVGHVTGMKDCRWSDPDTQTFVGAAVALDREYALASGLMEITYQSGARVILDGPCTFRVDSDAGGYLKIGKLTARIDGAKPQAENPEPRTPNPDSRNSSLIPHPSSFVVTTPTAVVTDLGTEFGVEVEQSGATTAYVFQDRVELIMPKGSNKQSVVQLGEGESARADVDLKQIVSISRQEAKPESFVRNIKGTSTFGASPKYVFQEIKGDDGDMRAVALNDAGLVVGHRKNSSGKLTAYAYDSASDTIRELPDRGGRISFAQCVNNSGQIVGYTTTADEEDRKVACLWDGRDNVVLLDKEGKYRSSQAWGINDAGTISGFGVRGDGSTHAFIYTRQAGLIELDGLGGSMCKATEINNAGQIVGYSTSADDSDERAFIYGDGTTTDLGAGGGVSSRAFAVNNSTTVVGYASNIANFRGATAFVCRFVDGKPQMNRLASSGAFSIAFDVNDAGWIVGRFWSGIDMVENYRAFVHVDGKTYDLNKLTDLPEGYVLRQARGINNAGRIAAWGTDATGRKFAALLKPEAANGRTEKGGVDPQQ